MSSIRTLVHTLRAKTRLIRMNRVLLISSVALALVLSIGITAIHQDVAMAVACDNPRALNVEEALGQSASWGTMKADWINFKVQKDSRYLLQASNAEGLALAVYDRCDASAPAVALRGGQLEFTATRDGEYYLLVKQDGVSATSMTGYQVSLSPAAPHPPSFTPAQDVPTDVLRRATEFLEELRGSGLAPEWVDARINPVVGILYRPDIQGPAYYECRVEKPAGKEYVPAGYIQLAAGEHDYTIVSWDMTGMSSTQELEELAPLGATLTQIYRLNAVSYAAEYEEFTPIGITTAITDVATLGDLPNRIEGLEALPDEPFELVTQGIDSDGKETYEGPANLPLLEETPWETWAALKAGFEENYAPLNRSLKQRASKEWELEKNLSKYGESLVKGDVRTIYGLAAQTLSSIQVTGDGAVAQYLKQERMIVTDTLTGIILTVLDEPTDLATLLPFEVALQYTSGVTETLKYAIVNHSALTQSNPPIYLPLVGKPGSQDQAVASVVPETALSWGPWHYYWVDSSGDALAERYNQIPTHTRMNTSGCYSGCGATAWVMLFGWVDRRAAEGHPTWANHWGLYRVNGSVAGANAVAPLIQDAWGGIENMTWEIRNYIHTFCSGTGGATYFTDMIDAYHYVSPRATAGWRMTTKYDPTGLCWFGSCNPARNQATDQIVYRRAPAIIAANNHYPMAVGYAWQSETSCFLWWCSTDYNRWFYVNNGWGGYNNGWVDWDDVQFSGIYSPW